MKKIHLCIAALLISLHFILSLIFVLIPGSILHALGLRRGIDKYVLANGRLIGRTIVFLLGGKVEIRGKEFLPTENRNICFVSNHRSLTDIPLIVGYLPLTTGFIAKQELKKVPILSIWMNALGCVYIDRKNPRSQVKAILDGAKAIAAGHPQVIFPEGTRSRSESFGTFKPGSIKLATRSKAIIVPLTLHNTSSLLEAKEGVKPRKVVLQIHEPIETAQMDEIQLKGLPETVFTIIKSGHL